MAPPVVLKAAAGLQSGNVGDPLLRGQGCHISDIVNPDRPQRCRKRIRKRVLASRDERSSGRPHVVELAV
jgi:hypothetical protein